MILLSKTNKQSAFTIVELLVVIVVIGILAGITIVSYTGISNRAIIVTLQSDLSNASTQFKIFQIDNGVYPSTISTNCTTTPTTTTNLCLKASPGNSYTTVAYSNPTPQSFILTEVNGNNTYHITEDSTPVAGVYVDPNWITVGTQTWARANLNVGTMVTGVTNQTNNAIVEKYCYNNLESNCTTYGALYQWNEAMQYVTTAGAQGICPVNSHIPTDTEWKTLEKQLGMTQIEADVTVAWRGTDQGTKLKAGGVSEMNIPFAGFRDIVGTFNNSPSFAYLWSSSESSSSAWDRRVNSTEARVYRTTIDKANGFSIRCVKN